MTTPYTDQEDVSRVWAFCIEIRLFSFGLPRTRSNHRRLFKQAEENIVCIIPFKRYPQPHCSSDCSHATC